MVSIHVNSHGPFEFLRAVYDDSVEDINCCVKYDLKVLKTRYNSLAEDSIGKAVNSL